jgi:hypothetical protein
MKKKITLTKVFVNHESKDGKPFKTPLVNITFTSEEGKELRASSFVATDSPALNWKGGDSVELEFEKNGEYLNFKAPKLVDALEARVKALEDVVFKTTKVAEEVFVQTTKIEDLPF